MNCKWTVRPGTNNSFWAFTPCKRGFNYLSKVKTIDAIKDAYDGRLCPICGKNIEINMSLLEDIIESGEEE